MKKYFISILCVLATIIVFGQSHQIDGTISNLAEEEVYLMRIVGQNRTIVDTAKTDLTGSFTFRLEKDFPVGMYAVIYGPAQIVELIYNNENIRFISGGVQTQSPVQVIESVENLIYYDYLYLKGYNMYKMEVLEPAIQQYPKDDDFYKTLLGEYAVLGEQLAERTEQLIRENPKTIASHFIKADSPYLTDPELPEDLKKMFLKSHFFDNTDFNDTLLIRSNILTSKIIGYLSLYQKKEMTQEQMEENLLIAVDTILDKAIVNQPVYEFTIDFLVDGFQAIGFENGLEHLASKNQLEKFCENTARKAELENKMELIKRLAIGKIAPDFSVNDLNGKLIKLSEIKARKTVLVFWASWCPHCDEILPILQRYYNPSNTDSLEVIAISLDKLETEVRASIGSGDYKWINIAELQGWDGPIVLDYGIAATPSLFVLDENKTILSKPLNKYEIEEALK